MGSLGGRRYQSGLAARAKGRHNRVAPLLYVRDLQTQDEWQGNKVSSRGNKLRSSTRQELIRRCVRGIHWQLEAWRRFGVKIWSTCMQPASRSVALHWRHLWLSHCGCYWLQPGILLNIPQYTGQPPSPTKNDLVLDVNSAKAEKAGSRSKIVNSGPTECRSMCKVNFYYTWESCSDHFSEVTCFAEQGVQCSLEKAPSCSRARGEVGWRGSDTQAGRGERCHN